MTLSDGLTIVAIVVPVATGLAMVPAKILWDEVQLSRRRFHEVNQHLTTISVNIEVLASKAGVSLPMHVRGGDGE